MADALYSASCTGVATGTALKTILQTTMPSGRRGRVAEVHITFDGTSSTATPVLVSLQRQTSAGTGGTSVTPVSLDPNDTSTSGTAQKGPAGTWTAEPTAGDIVYNWRVPPTSGLVVQYPLGREPVIDAGGRIAIVVTAAATVNATATLVWAE